MLTSGNNGSGRIPLRARFSDEARFLKAWVENPGTTGAVSPSGKHLARMMARYVDPSVPGPVIELGPGTGPVTQALIERGVAEDRLVLVEYDPAFCTLLQDRFPAATVIQGDAYDLPATLHGQVGAPAAAVVSSLPLLNKPEADRVRIMRDAFDLLHPAGNVVQFTYGMVSPVPRKLKDGTPTGFVADASPPVWLNIPPARVWTYQVAGEVVSLERARERFSLKAERSKLLDKLKKHTGKIKEHSVRVRDGFLDQCDRIETDLRLARETVRIDFELRAAHLRQRNRLELDDRFDRHLRPALSLIRRLGENRRADGQIR
ncbi:MAG: methyltransferase domain-containing protein [Beijerinckiaceae bacterium]|nr:methyltransferase domain-containing protein [Beijerinckiaceae bacterium]